MSRPKKKQADEPQTVPTSIRFPREYLKQLRVLAERNHRSVNGEVLAAVEAALRAGGLWPPTPGSSRP
jgi:hypothetical protein